MNFSSNRYTQISKEDSYLKSTTSAHRIYKYNTEKIDTFISKYGNKIFGYIRPSNIFNERRSILQSFVDQISFANNHQHCNCSNINDLFHPNDCHTQTTNNDNLL